MRTSAKREKEMQVNLESAVHKVVCDLVKKLDTSQSSYLRSLVLADLRERGLLTDAIIADMVVGAGS